MFPLINFDLIFTNDPVVIICNIYSSLPTHSYLSLLTACAIFIYISISFCFNSDNCRIIICIKCCIKLLILRDIRNLMESRLRYQLHFLSLSLSLFHTHIHTYTHMITYLGRKVFQNGRAVHRSSSAYPTMTRSSVFQMPVNSAYGELQ